MAAYIINTTGATIVIGTKTFTIRRDHINYTEILTALGNDDEARVLSLVDIPESIKQVTQGKVTVDDNGVFFNGEELHTGLADRILNLIREGQQGLANPLVAFLNNLMNNPSRRAVQGLYEWLQNSDLPITTDGCFIAWKIVDPNFKDLRTHTFDNSPGKTVEVRRNEVDEDPNKTCSYGLHFCSTNYLPHYGRAAGNKVVMVKVNPADVVAFPYDYNTSKGRCCKYEVLSEVNREAAPTLFSGTSGVYDPQATPFKPIGFYTSEDNIVLFDENSKELKTNLPVNDDYAYEAVDGNDRQVKLVPSGRIVNL